MNSLLGFMLEQSIKNTAPIFLTVLFFAYVGGPFLINLGTTNKLRLAIYSFIGAIAGLFSYIYFDLPDRSIELLEAITLGFSMFIYVLIVVGLVILFKNRKSEK